MFHKLINVKFSDSRSNRTLLAVLHVTTCRCVIKPSCLGAVGEHITASATHNEICFLKLSMKQRHPCFSGGCGTKHSLTDRESTSSC